MATIKVYVTWQSQAQSREPPEKPLVLKIIQKKAMPIHAPEWSSGQTWDVS